MTDDGDSETLVDYQERSIRLTAERWEHILEHPEMSGQRWCLAETLAAPDKVVATVKDEQVHAYHRYYEDTPVTRKYMVVVIKLLPDDAFVLTAFFASKLKKGNVVWQR
jgi:hypothetical protein